MNHMLPTSHSLRHFVVCLVGVLLVGGGSFLPGQAFAADTSATILITDPDPLNGIDEYTGGRMYAEVELCLYAVDGATGPLEGSAFDFTVCYDNDILFLRQIERGSGLSSDWEYLSYRIGQTPAGCTACPAGQFRIVGVADIDDGQTPGPDAYTLSGCLAHLVVVTSRDANYNGTCAPMAFCSFDCTDNTVTSVDGSTLYVAGNDVTLADGYDTAGCGAALADAATVDSSIAYVRSAVCVFELDDVGDMNLNGKIYEAGDAVVFANYFLYGDDALDPSPPNAEVQRYASDINNDGLILTIADYVTLLNFIRYGRDAGTVEAPKPVPSAAQAAGLSISRSADGLSLTYTSSTTIGGAFFTFDLNGAAIAEPYLLQQGALPLSARVRGNELRILVGSETGQAGGTLPAGQVELLRIPGDDISNIELTHFDLSDAEGHYLDVQLAAGTLPRSSDLGQNFPNPFNSSTIIPYTLTDDGHVRLDVYDVLGRRMTTLVDDHVPMGQHEAAWDGTDDRGRTVATGVYFYRLTIDEQTSSRSMLLLK